MPTRESDRRVADEIAEHVRARNGRRGGWFEVRSLLGHFGIDRFSEEARERMTAALAEAGLEVAPPLAQTDRRDTVVLSPAAAERAPMSEGDLESLRAVLTVRVATAAEMHEAALEALAPGHDVVWFDLADSAKLHPDAILETLGPHCPGLTREMVADVLSPDPRPGIKEYAAGSVRCVSAFGVEAQESDEGAKPGSCSKAGVLVFQPVEFLVADRWLVTCWHDVEVYRAAKRIRESPPEPPADLFAEVVRCWPRGGYSSAGDLALLVLGELCLTYAPAYRRIYDWQEEWELDFYRRPDHIDRDTLLEIRAEAAVLRDWLSPLNPSGMREDVAKAWFPGITGTPESGGYKKALRIDDRIDHALQSIREFANTLRSSYDLQQLREGERERERDDKFQRNIAVGGSVLLFPALVAGVMGANTWVPGQWREPNSPPHWAFLALIGVIAVSGLVAFGAIKWLQRRDERSR